MALSFTPCWVFYLVGAYSWDTMLMTATTYASMTASFGTTIAEVKAGAGVNIPCIGLRVLFFCLQYVDIQAMALKYWPLNFGLIMLI